ncbi:diaminopimelate aminotransferase [Thermosipho melanesiensis]|uniref:Acetylornithine deacetylase or succinyl-diaminopimelate desuccinylase n=2 Tax=Thermosipho melanesiensis TaxID=46541 RepID=A6LP74_THEM4|nr:M20 family metallo-hydrolase [Thermosipho melanesiensis]ABR31725.1 acetylornithine deacetylase or succinyl-diaminopimelate desuccinylase [Thermosipho melanesiensis BI429]APT74747.1 diaminopimelate aminotransferase [Thermosipho melanesiensis]OOC35249.1 diaminopimelate aminotransferase [Thermosipho melanesiensis]OOC35459.1 diaminopimelate aminotransferase [Thermosipho melanesiensis]OOC36711.1 diaminopimelate aminotransferase [Thermosipho melanesiensis]
MKKKIIQAVEKLKPEIIESMKKFISINSVNPRSGGPGEKEMAEWLENLIKDWGFDVIERHDAKDIAVPYGYRPNIVAKILGSEGKRTIWIVTHMDKVPEGDLSLWNSDPFTPVEKDGKIFGRGAEDNGSSLIASLYAAKTILSLKIKPKDNIALAFVSDEETGSDYGIKHLVKLGIFGKDDLFIVPDSGEPDGSFIEIAEKSIAWLKITTKGKQAHASRPDIAKNAHRFGLKFASQLDEYLNEKYTLENKLFDYPKSSFEPTKKEGNVDNINTIPGTDIVYFDCRILPNYNLEEIFSDIKRFTEEFSKKYNIEIEIEKLQFEQAAPPTDENSEIVKKLKNAIKEMRNIEPRVGGIGGGTCAAIVRRAGFPAVVWATIDETAHQPNEYVVINNLIEDTKVYTYLIANS